MEPNVLEGLPDVEDVFPTLRSRVVVLKRSFADLSASSGGAGGSKQP